MKGARQKARQRHNSRKMKKQKGKEVRVKRIHLVKSGLPNQREF